MNEYTWGHCFLLAGIVCMGVGLFTDWPPNSTVAFAFGLGLATQPMLEIARLVLAKAGVGEER